MSAWYIASRVEFFEVLEKTIQVAQRRADAVPAYGIYRRLLRQLQAMRDWTAGGRTPEESERDSIDIGLIAIREIDPQIDDDTAAFNEALVQLDGYFCEWPEDESS